MSLRLVFAGTPEFAAEHLRALLTADHEIVAVYTQPDRPAGRGRKLQPSPVKALALEHNLPVFQPLNFKAPSEVEQLAGLNADVMVVVAYGLILPQAVLNVPKFGCVNVHASLLPRWRGAAPIHRALLAGDSQTGVTIMQMDQGLDTGDMLTKAQCDILPTDTSATLHDRLIELGGPALVTTLAHIERDTLIPEPQDDTLATYAHKLEKSEGRVHWSATAEDIDRQIRGLTPWPGTFTYWNGDTCRILSADVLPQAASKAPGDIERLDDDAIVVATASRCLSITRIQLPGKKAMAVKDLLNARRQHFVDVPRFTSEP